jgi:hypothetical protein
VQNVFHSSRALVFTGAILGVAAAASAATVPFTEGFNSTANWSIGPTLVPPTLVPTGGPDGSSYIQRAFSFAANGAGETPILLRAQSGFGSSGGALFGSYLADGVTQFSFSVRHNAPEPLDIFARFSTAAPGAGVVAVSSAVAPNVWTDVTVLVSPGFPFIFEGSPALFNTVFGTTGVGRIQFGPVVPASLAGTSTNYTFELDNVSIVPAPSAVAGLMLAGLAAGRRRRAR